MHFYNIPLKSVLSKLLSRPNPGGADISALVADVLAAVKEKGDQAIIDFNTRFDGFASPSFEVTEDEIKEAVLSLPEILKKAILSAAANITAFHEKQKVDQEPVETMPGVLCWLRDCAYCKSRCIHSWWNGAFVFKCTYVGYSS